MRSADPYRLDKRRVARTFNRAAAGYDAAAVLQHTVGARLTERLSLFRLDPELILDLGSGTGRGARALLGRYRHARLLALDLALEMLRHGRASEPRWFSRQRPICADAERLPLAAASIDLLYSNLTLQWVNDLDATLEEFRRVLKPGGLLLFTTFGPDTLMELRQSWAAVDAAVHVSAFLDMHDVGDALVRSGFSSPVLDVERITLTYADVGDLLRDLTRIGARNAALGRSRAVTGRAAFRRLAEAYERYRDGGRLPATHEVIYAHAWAPQPGERPQDGSTVAAFPFERLRDQLRGCDR